MLGLVNMLSSSKPSSSDWTPANISSLIAWYKFDEGISTYFVGGSANNHVVSEWRDKSGSNNHLTDTSTPAQTASYNTTHPKQDQTSKRVIFDHGGDSLRLTTSLDLGSFSVTMRIFPDGTWSDFIWEDASGNNFLKIQTAEQARVKIDGSRHDFNLPEELSDDEIFNISWERNQEGVIQIYIDGVAGTQSGTGDGTEDITELLTIEKIGEPMNAMEVAEIVICNNALSSRDRDNLQTYLDNI